MQSNSFDCLAAPTRSGPAVGGGGSSGKRRRRRRGQSDPMPSPSGSEVGGNSGGLPAAEGLGLERAGSGPADLAKLDAVQLAAAPSMVRQSSEGCLDQATQTQAGSVAGPTPPTRSRSDLSTLVDLHPLGRSRSQVHSTESGLGSIHEGPASTTQQAAQEQPARVRPRPTEAFFQPFSEYLNAELHPGPSYPTADVVWGQTERDRVYNAILAVPYQLERFLWFGMLVCLDSFLAVFTLLPVRFSVALYTAARDFLSSRLTARRQQQQQRGGAPSNSKLRAGSSSAAEGGAAGGAGTAASPAPAAAAPGGGDGGAEPAGRGRLGGDQLYDLLGVLIFLGTVLFLWHLNAGMLYFWMKDLTQEFLKLSVLFTALELGDKICCNFGVDVLEALAASCTQFMKAPALLSKEAANLASDVVVAAVLVIVHGAALMSQAMVFGVAMNSKKNALVALLIAANFTEIKGTVLKRFDSSKLYVLACQDIVERFHLLITLAFVVVEEMASSGHTTPNPAILVQCAQIFFSEAVIDVIKHAVLGKFNEIRPGVYREFMKDLCDRVARAQSHNIHKVVGFEPFAPTALAFRITVTYLAIGAATSARPTPWQVAAGVGAAAAAWAALFVAKLLLGYLLKLASAHYVRHYELKRSTLKARDRRVTMAALVREPAASTKKEE